MTSSHDDDRTSGDNGPSGESDPIESYLKDFDEAEKKVAGEIDPGVRALVVAIAVVILLGSLTLPHSGVANGWEVLVYGDDARAEVITLPSRLFVWFEVVFGVVASMLALITRRWALAWVALAGTAVSIVFGMLAIWTRQTPAPGVEAAGPGIGLIIGWLTVIVLTFHWLKVVWSRTALQLAAEEERRAAAAEAERRGDWNV
ncbi:hypothetical protein R4282_04800 [Rhodococcus oxybenzonivorans]|uniref:Rv2732c family membrane protein n=1 Tax=Rhodococcus TaxID=1827 RepID=UPI0013203FBA|nr:MULTISPECIES: hypothetical protein [Rhodococcus]MDV7352335.1 hypothetical protein [Rhodococcus oxybenzonivorans]QHE72235.1 putative membrane protein [Rhodococcus sp. WAY2]